MTTSPADCPAPDLHGNPFRYCPNCSWMEEPEPKTPIAQEHTGEHTWGQYPPTGQCPRCDALNGGAE